MSMQLGGGLSTSCNNNPVNWDAPHGFSPVKEDGSIDQHHFLSRATIETTLADSFGTDENPRFRNREASREVFSFWSGVRFGPMLTK